MRLALIALMFLGRLGPITLATVVADAARPGDVVVCLGAGDITSWAYALPGQLAELEVGA